MNYKILGSPMKIGSCEIKNRIVLPPMLMGFASLDGKKTSSPDDFFIEKFFTGSF